MSDAMTDAPAITKERRIGLMSGNAHFRSDIHAYELALAASEAREAELREALQPFVRAEEDLREKYTNCDDNELLVHDGAYETLADVCALNFGHFRRARAAYERGK